MEGIIDILVSDKAFQQLQDINAQMDECSKTMLKWITISQNLEVSLNNIGTQKEMAKFVGELSKSLQDLERATVDMNKLDKERADLMKRLADQADQLNDANNALAKGQKTIAELTERLSQARKNQEQATRGVVSAYADESNTVNKARENLSNLMKAYSDNRLEANKLEVTLKDLQRQYSELANHQKHSASGVELKGEIDGVSMAIKELNGQRKDLVKEIERETKFVNLNQGSLTQLRVELSRLSKEYDGMSKSMRESPAGQALQKQIKGLSDELKSLEKDTGRSQRGVGEYERGIGGLTKSLGINLKALTAVGIAVTALKGIKEGFNKVISATSDSQDRFNIMIAGAKSGIDYFWRALSSGNFDNFTQGLKDAIKAGEEYQALLIELEGRTRSLATAEAEKDRDVAKLRTEAADTQLSKDVRIELLEEALKKEKDFFEMQVDHLDEIQKTEVDYRAKIHGLDAEKLKAFVNQYHERREEIEALKEIVSLENKVKQARQDLKHGGQASSVYAGQILESATKELKELRKQHADVTDENINDWRKYGTVTGDIRDKIAKQQQDVYRAQERLDTSTRRMVTQIANLRKGKVEDSVNSEKNLIDITNIRLQAEANALKKASADERNSLDERLQAYKGFVGKQEDILRGNAGVAIKEAKGDSDKIALVHAKLNDDLRKLDEGLNEFRKTEAIKIMDRISEARRQMIEIEINAELEKAQKIADNERNSLLVRTNANQTYYNTKIKILQDAYNRELELGNLNDDELKALEAKTQADIAKLREEATAKQEKMFLDSIQKQIDARRDALKDAEAKELEILSAQYAKGEVKREEYEKKKTEIQKKYAQESRDLEANAIVESLKTLQERLNEMRINFPEMDTSEVEEKILALQNRIVEINTESNEKMGDANKTMWERFKADAEKALGMTESQLQEFAQTIGGIFSGIQDLIAAASANRIAAFDAELEKLDERKKKEQEALDNAIMGDERRAIEQKKLDIQQENARKIIEDKKKAEQRKQAQFEKKWALVQVLINTAVGVMKAAPVIPLMAAIGVMGAVQAAVVAAQPIPSYEKGTEYHPGGWAEVSERRPEAAILPTGEVLMTPKKAGKRTFMNLPKGTIVKPDYRAFVEDQARDVVRNAREVDMSNKAEYREMLDSNKKIEQYLRDISMKEGSSVSVHMDKHGFFHSMENERKRTNYLNYCVHANYNVS